MDIVSYSFLKKRFKDIFRLKFSKQNNFAIFNAKKTFSLFPLSQDRLSVFLFRFTDLNSGLAAKTRSVPVKSTAPIPSRVNYPAIVKEL